MNFIKKNYKFIIGFLIGGIIFGCVAVYATTYLANDVQYTQSKTVKGALDELYTKIPSGNKTITANGTGIDVSQYETVDVNVTTDKVYTEAQYQAYGTSQYNAGINAAAQASGYKAGIQTLNEVKVYTFDCGFKPKYIMIMVEFTNGNTPTNILYYYNEKVSTTNSYRINKTTNAVDILQMEMSSTVSSGTPNHICDVFNTGFRFYNQTFTNTRRVSWVAYQ